MTWETFPHAPIVEAILDLRVTLPADVGVGQLERIFTEAYGYPHREPMHQFTSEIRLSRDSVGSDHAKHAVGSMYLSEDRSRIVQARLNGFTVNHLKPYTSWLSLSGEAQKLWPSFVRATRPIEVTRIALRYVNKVVVPRSANPREYFNLEIHVGAQPPKFMHPVAMKAAFNDDARGAKVVLNYGAQPTEGEDVPVILDIDAFREGSFAPDSDEIWDVLSELRELKNETFFAATTAKAKEAFR